jgi:hypothetical protein
LNDSQERQYPNPNPVSQRKTTILEKTNRPIHRKILEKTKVKPISRKPGKT